MRAAPSPKILAFDIFGTVVDWHGSIAREVDAMQLGVSGNDFALAWRAGYQPAMQRVRSLLAGFGIHQLSEAQKRHLNRVWHRLDAWPDSVQGIARLKARHIVCTLSNGNIGLLTNMAKRAGLPWDCILSAEVFRAYKPDPQTYLGVAATFDVAPEDVMLVAAHHDDLVAARACGLLTAYIERAHEFGADQPKDVSPKAGNTLHCASILELADQLGC
jgi:2-haloacid dehalogenase